MRRWGSRLFFIAVGLGAIGFFSLVYLQYLTWRDSGPPAAYLVPPYRDAGYVIGYIIGHGAQSYFISLGAALIFLGFARWLNERFQKRFFEDGEPYLGAFGIFILGNPWWIYYLVSVILIALLVTGYRLLVTKEKFRFSLSYLWLPLTVLILIISKLPL